jgi:phosphonatase-like hydrolase
MKPALVVFDMVGTTVAATDDVTVALQESFAAEGLSVSPEAMAAIRGRRKTEAITELLRQLEPQAPSVAERTARIVRAVRERLVALYSEYPVRPIPGAEKTLRWLLDQGIKVAFTTGLDGDLARLLLDQLGWRNTLVSTIVCGDDVESGRPAPDMIRRAMQLAGVEDPGRVAVVGDTAADLQSAKNAGAGYAIGVLSGAGRADVMAKLPHTVLLDSIADLPALWRD